MAKTSRRTSYRANPSTKNPASENSNYLNHLRPIRRRFSRGTFEFKNQLTVRIISIWMKHKDNFTENNGKDVNEMVHSPAVGHFEETDSALETKAAGDERSSENIGTVQASVARSPTQSARKHSRIRSLTKHPSSTPASPCNCNH
ncbi:hypothetical protein Trydic_g19742 [Trypoxylus dichotomus]